MPHKVKRRFLLLLRKLVISKTAGDGRLSFKEGTDMDYSLVLMDCIYQLSVPASLRICEELQPFLSEKISPKVMIEGEISLSFAENIPGPANDAELYPSESLEEIREYSDNRCIVYNRKSQKEGFLTKSILEKKKIVVICDSSYQKKMLNSDILLKKLYLESFFLLNHSFILHSSLIQFKGTAIAFCAPKQTGKSTQASLWEKEMGAKILNGDRSGIKLPDPGSEHQEIMAYGLPYAGSSSIYINEGAPLKAIILLEQATENTLEPVPSNIAFGKMFSQVNVPRTDELLLTLAIGYLEEVIRSVPVYLLKCTPDWRAVKLVYNELFRKERQSFHD